MRLLNEAAEKTKRMDAAERQWLREQRQQQRLSLIPKLLYARDETARALNISIMNVIRLEERGKLTPVRLRGAAKKHGKVFYRVAEVEALVERKCA
jgi:hypothetical protein